MIHVILIAHGDFAQSLVDSAQLIVGEQERIYTYSLDPGDSVDQLKEDVAAELECLSGDAEILMLTDLFSGSPFNVAVSLTQHYSFQHITGVNLPLLLAVMTLRETTDNVDELSDAVMSEAKGSIINVNDFLKEADE